MSRASVRDKGDITHLAAPFVREGSAVVDVGANTGGFTKWAAQIVGPTGSVLAIEPDTRCYDLLDHLAAVCPQVTLHRGAVGAWPGPADCYQAKHTSQTSLWRAAVPAGDTVTTTRVDVTTLDALVARADLVKIDAQGMDAEILVGATRLLQACPAWIVEVWPNGLAAAGQTPKGLWELLTQAGLTVTWAGGVVVTEENLRDWCASKQAYVNWLATRPTVPKWQEKEEA